MSVEPGLIVPASAKLDGGLPGIFFRRRDLRQLLRRYRRGYDLLPECIFIFDLNLRKILDVNRAACLALGYTRSELLDRSPSCIVPRDAWLPFAEEIRKAIEGGRSIAEFDSLQRTRWARAFSVRWKIKVVRKLRTRFILAIARNVSQSSEVQRSFNESAGRDPLTGLPDRRCFDEQMGRKFAGLHSGDRQGVAVFFIDLDHFKRINDTLGHRAGDKALCETGRRLSESVRACDLVARYGGDEFTILAGPLADESEAVQLAERIIGRLAMPLAIDGREVSLSASVGIAWSACGDLDAENMIDRADDAMYRAKAQGGSRFELHRE
jgi:diguanylate cyclase (GGDEF)-like protein/PAS domain S-box-containing protein